MPTVARIILYPILFLLGLAVAGCAVAVIVLIIAYPNLPSLGALTDYRPNIPLRVYSSDGYLIGEFGEERRAPIKIQEVPEHMKQALLAAEDDRFYQHSGIDPAGIARATYVNLTSQGKRQGASTITMQVARNFFLTQEKTLTRKFYEALLSFKIEHNLTKDQILELYINQIFLGQRAYGFAAAAQIYFGKPLEQVSIAEAAMLGGLPRAPSTANPVVNPKRARQRQEYVLRRMRELSYITEEQRQEALAETLVIKRDIASQYSLHAEYVAEMARQIAVERFPDTAYSGGLQVITTITRDEQEAAYQALRQGVLDYDRRQGYRGAEAYVDLEKLGAEADADTSFDETLDLALHEFPAAENMLPAIVFAASPKEVKAHIRDGESITLSGDALKFAARMLGDKAPAAKKLRRGAIIRVSRKGEQWEITQLPEVESAFVATNPENGAIRALVGGFDFNRNMYNHVTQAWRQPGSSFKPFIYSAALEKGYSPGSIVLDEPLAIDASGTGKVWQPHNYDGKYDGPITLRTALMRSKNLVSVRLLQAINPVYAQDYVTRFGFNAKDHPPYLTMALGAGSVTPWQMATAYSVFANGGYRISPYVVREIRDQRGRVLAEARPPKAGDEKLRAIEPRNAYMMYSMLRDVAIGGTAARASAALKRHDLAGKTGTTNDFLDAWFCGFQKTVVGCAWVGYDQPRKMGSGETGGRVALPIWISFMQPTLKNVPEMPQAQPKGIAAAYGDMYYAENVPPPPEADPTEGEGGESSIGSPPANIFKPY
ncbi:penicillin-binding protein 1A [Betaproteobacteria bacterium]|nr:penicillin-binding protein 1A [Betaproteobacteria bacterium]GHU44155.1 penicillin-binding protein 1A [Betaproteobacteria bacterium]